MTIILYDLCARDTAVRFSPHCWKVKLALAHKGLAFETRPTPFTRIPEIGGGFSQTVPVIDDGGRLVRDSFEIAVYLDETYPDRPSLFGGESGRGPARFVESWTLAALNAPLTTLIIKDIHDRLDAPDQAFFRETRERRFGRTLGEVMSGREDRLEAFRAVLQPLRTMLAKQPFIGGMSPLFADYIVFGVLQWRACRKPVPGARGRRFRDRLVRALPRSLRWPRKEHAGGCLTPSGAISPLANRSPGEITQWTEC